MLISKVLRSALIASFVWCNYNVYGMIESESHAAGELSKDADDQNDLNNAIKQEIEIVKRKQHIEIKERKKSKNKEKKLFISEPIGTKRHVNPSLQSEREKRAREIKNKIDQINDEKRVISLYQATKKKRKEALDFRNKQFKKAASRGRSTAGISEVIRNLETLVDNDRQAIVKSRKKIRELEESMTLYEIREAEKILDILLL